MKGFAIKILERRTGHLREVEWCGGPAFIWAAFCDADYRRWRAGKNGWRDTDINRLKENRKLWRAVKLGLILLLVFIIKITR